MSKKTVSYLSLSIILLMLSGIVHASSGGNAMLLNADGGIASASSDYAGLGLIFFGLIFMLAEAFMPTFGVLGISGWIAFVVGSMLLMNSDLPGYQLAMPLMIVMAMVTGVFFFIVIGMAFKARRRAVVSGRELLHNRIGEALDDIDEIGQARIHGEIWCVQTNAPVKKGMRIRVIDNDGLLLKVEPYQEKTK